MEDSPEDVSYIAAKLNLSELLPELSKVNRKTGQGQSQDRVEGYMSQLDQDVRGRLYELYKLDFDLFGYDPSV